MTLYTRIACAAGAVVFGSWMAGCRQEPVSPPPSSATTGAGYSSPRLANSNWTSPAPTPTFREYAKAGKTAPGGATKSGTGGAGDAAKTDGAPADVNRGSYSPTQQKIAEGATAALLKIGKPTPAHQAVAWALGAGIAEAKNKSVQVAGEIFQITFPYVLAKIQPGLAAPSTDDLTAIKTEAAAKLKMLEEKANNDDLAQLLALTFGDNLFDDNLYLVVLKEKGKVDVGVGAVKEAGEAVVAALKPVAKGAGFGKLLPGAATEDPDDKPEKKDDVLKADEKKKEKAEKAE